MTSFEQKPHDNKGKRNIVIAISIISVFCVIIAFVFLLVTFIIPNKNYNDAITMMDEKKYTEAIAVFEALGDFKDSKSKIEECNTGILDCKYNDALSLMDAGKFTEAKAAFEELEGFKYVNDKIEECNCAIQYNNALELMNAKKYTEAIAAFAASNGYKDSKSKIEECNIGILDDKYNEALALMSAKKYTEAIAAFEAIIGYKDSENKIEECNIAILDAKYNDAIALMNAGNIDEAYSIFNELGDYKDAADKAGVIRLTKNKEQFKNIKAGNYIKFGAYEQDNNISNGKEDIEWFVLEVKDNKALVISKYGLDGKGYNSSYTDVTWETCTLRKWLNSDFINSAFSADEKAMIPTVTVSADKNPYYSTNPGNATQDQVFLLSITEANKYFSSDSARQCKPTDYAVAKGGWVSGSGLCWWWLRSPGLIQGSAASVNRDGDVGEIGDFVSNDGNAVRPALWIDLNA